MSGQAPPPWSGTNGGPDAPNFGAEADRLLERTGLVAVTGPAGCGKSSLVRTGLAKLRAAGAAVFELQAEADPVGRLHAALGTDDLDGVDLTDTVLFLDQFEDYVRNDPAAARMLLNRLAELANRATSNGGARPSVLLTLRPGSLDQLLAEENAAWLGAAVHFVAPRASRAGSTNGGAESPGEQVTAQRRWRGITATAVVLALVASVLSVVVADRSARLYDQLRTANSAVLARKANQIAERRPGMALQLALAAWREKPYSSPAYGALLSQRLYWRGADRLYQHPALLDDLPMSSSDGSVVVTTETGRSGRTLVWRNLSAEDPQPRPIRVDPANRVRLSPDGATLMEFGGSFLRIWDTRSGQERHAFNAPTDIAEVGFSAGGRYAAIIPPDDEPGLPVRTLDTRTAEFQPGGLPLSPMWNPRRVHPTDDGSALVLEESAAPYGATRVVVRGLVDGAERGVVDNARVAASGAVAVRCVGAQVSVVDTETARVYGELSGTGCPSTDVSGRFLLLPGAEGVSEVVYWPTWERRTLADPAQRRQLNDRALLVDSGQGVRAVAVRGGVLSGTHLGTTDQDLADVDSLDRELTAISPNLRHWTAYDAEAGSLVLLDEDFEVSEEIETDRPQAVAFDATGESVLTVTDGWFRVYDASDLSLKSEKRLPGSDGAPPDASILPYQGTEALVVHAGRLTSWDTSTAERTGDPIRLDSDPRVAKATLRPGWDQVLVNHGDGLAVWDLESRQRVARYPVELRIDESPVLDPAASMVALPTSENRVAVVELSTHRRPVVVGANVRTVHGLAENYVFVEDSGRFQAWDWRDRTLLTSRALDDGDAAGTRAVTREALLLNTIPGYQEAVPAEPEQWFQDLCGLADRDFTRSELRMLPVGAQPDRPCDVLLEQRR